MPLCSSVITRLPSMHKARNSIPSSARADTGGLQVKDSLGHLERLCLKKEGLGVSWGRSSVVERPCNTHQALVQSIAVPCAILLQLPCPRILTFWPQPACSWHSWSPLLPPWFPLCWACWWALLPGACSALHPLPFLIHQTNSAMEEPYVWSLILPLFSQVCQHPKKTPKLLSKPQQQALMLFLLSL